MESDNQLLQIDKISDDVLTITSNIVLRFNVALSKIVSNKRQHFHKEFMYSSKTSPEPLVTIRRAFDYYLSFENVKNSYDKLFIRIGIGEILLLRRGFDIAASWFTDIKYEKLYARDSSGKLFLTAPIPDYVIRGLPQGKYIILTPTVVELDESNAGKVPGITIDFGDGVNIINLTLERFMGLKYVISCFNMYQSATTLLNYISRPCVGTNSMNFSTNGRTLPPENIACGADGIDGRKVQPKHMPQNISTLEG